MRRIQLALIVALAALLHSCVHGQVAATGANSDLVRINVLSKGTTRTHRDLGRKRGKSKGKGGKAVWKQGGKSNSHVDTNDGTDFYGFQFPQPQPQQPQRNDEDDSLSTMHSQSASSSESTSKRSKKSKKNRKGDSHKPSHKLSKKSNLSSSSKGQAPSPSSYPMIPTASPTFSPSHTGDTDPTPSPTTSVSTQHLTPFALEYTVTEDDRIPFRSELLEVVELTRAYLATYFQDIVEDNNDVTLTEFITIFTDTQSDFGDPVYIAYRSSALFEASDSAVISIQELDSQLKGAFVGRNLDGYLGMLQALAPSNLFSTTAFVTKVDVREERQSLSAVATVGIRTKTSANGQNAMAGVAAGVTGMTLMGAVGLFYRRQLRATSERPSEKDDGDATSFTTGTWSLDHVSGLQPKHSSGRNSLT